jgi:hypothetical protein
MKRIMNKPLAFWILMLCILSFTSGCATTQTRWKMPEPYLFASQANSVPICGTLTDPRKEPTVPVTKSQLVKLLKLKKRCARWPSKCKQRVKDEIARVELRWKRRLELKNTSLKACEEKRQICLKKRCKCDFLTPVLIASGGGIAVGVLGTIILVFLVR